MLDPETERELFYSTNAAALQEGLWILLVMSLINQSQ
jgi:hypothetical protein